MTWDEHTDTLTETYTDAHAHTNKGACVHGPLLDTAKHIKSQSVKSTKKTLFTLCLTVISSPCNICSISLALFFLYLFFNRVNKKTLEAILTPVI